MNNYFVILAAGKSKRFHKNIAKQFYKYKNKEIIDHSIEKSLNSNLFRKVLVVTNNVNHFRKKNYSKSINIIKGGRERSDSSLLALKYLKNCLLYMLFQLPRGLALSARLLLWSLTPRIARNLASRVIILCLSRRPLILN